MAVTFAWLIQMKVKISILSSLIYGFLLGKRLAIASGGMGEIHDGIGNRRRRSLPRDDKIPQRSH
ncbi:hypothetical protein PMG71_02900 [Roseofilum sp. BLCC_M154]|uniref:Uncharacterized protein n=1 Tax=Roseofilum acuticapitatum BLCC-M154 TaxID=3022444 RepID=A0ABT7ANA3_9CYAN|nr:hypothetical protein [Roseofilum acuticapitatum]MDJ1168370.1 hypothetical protein [Roseofilum acuticapitatum BLCC-M154]